MDRHREERERRGDLALEIATAASRLAMTKPPTTPRDCTPANRLTITNHPPQTRRVLTMTGR